MQLPTVSGRAPSIRPDQIDQAGNGVRGLSSTVGGCGASAYSRSAEGINNSRHQCAHFFRCKTDRSRSARPTGNQCPGDPGSLRLPSRGLEYRVTTSFFNGGKIRWTAETPAQVSRGTGTGGISVVWAQAVCERFEERADLAPGRAKRLEPDAAQRL